MKIKPTKIINVKPLVFRPVKKFSFRLDTDRDGVLDFKDCQWWNPRKQEISLQEYQDILLKGLHKKNMIKVINGYGIWRSPEGLYYAVDMNTGLIILNNRESLDEIETELQQGLPEQMKKEPERYGNLFSVEQSHAMHERDSKYHKKYGSKAKRFDIGSGMLVLDVGAGDRPDIRATHAIDLRQPRKQHDIDYQYGYNMNSETVEFPYPSNYFDIIVSYGAFGRNFATQKTANEIFRVLKPNGRFEGNMDYGGDLLRNAGFTDFHKETYYDEQLGKDVPVVIAIKRGVYY